MMLHGGKRRVDTRTSSTVRKSMKRVIVVKEAHGQEGAV